jgi:glycosyltransferase involved in cell wall biosynthesis
MHIAMIGIKAIPARFGGFETAVDETSRGLVRLGHQVTVYNRKGMSNHNSAVYDGVTLVELPTLKSKNLSTIVHAFLSTLHVTFRRVDVVHFFTTGATLFAPLPRLFGKKIVCSVDGCDWQRAKWGRFARWYLRLSEWIAARCCHSLISDSQDVNRYYAETYGQHSTCITYGVREYRSKQQEVLDHFGLKPREYVLFVGRLVPENNIHHLISAFENLKTEKHLVIVGDDPWERRYVQRLKSTTDPRIIFTGGVYGDGYAQLQQSAYLFVLPDEVGGTHPALVEAMGYGNCVLVNNTPSNLEVIGTAGFSYRGELGSVDLQAQLQNLLDTPSEVAGYRQRALVHATERYSWTKVAREHAAVYEELMGGSKPVNLCSATADRQQTEEGA